MRLLRIERSACDVAPKGLTSKAAAPALHDAVIGVGHAPLEQRHDALAHAFEFVGTGVEHLEALAHELIAVGAEHLAQGLVAVDHDAVARERQPQRG